MNITHFLLGVLESCLLASAGPSIIKLLPSTNKIFLVAIGQSLCVWLVRLIYPYLNIPLGSHTIILTITLILLLAMVGKLPVKEAMIAGFISIILLLLGEILFLWPLVKYVIKLPASVITADPLLLLVAGLSSEILLIVALIIGLKRNRRCIRY